MPTAPVRRVPQDECMAGTATKIGGLREGAPIEGVFACTRKERLTARSGSAYLTLELRDSSGSLPARVFRDADFLAGQFERGDLVRVSGRVTRFRDELQAELDSVRRAEGADPGAFLPVAYRDLDELDGFLEHLAGQVFSEDLKRLLSAFLADDEFRQQFRTAPCTRSGHHAYLGGLLEHTVAVCTLVQETCVLHPRLDSDLLMTAAVLHDIGKTREFDLGAEITVSEEGRLLGHLTLAQQMLNARGLPHVRSLSLQHCILAHHGPDALPGRRFGSPEALALFRLNALDASVKGALEHGMPA